jgi:hypothetical protein
LIGSNRAGRKWINYEIEKIWNDKKGLLGVYIQNLKNADGQQSAKENNPFYGFTVGANKKPLADIVKTYDPPGATSTAVYDHIKSNLASWVETAISIRATY